MRRLPLLLGLVALVVLVSNSAMAQGISLGVDAALVFPQDPLNNSTGKQIGALVRAEVSLLPLLSITGRLGYLYGMENKQMYRGAIDVIPILAGVKFFPVMPLGLYAAAELGLMNGTIRVSDNEKDESWTGMTIGAGFEISSFDLRLQAIFLDLDHMEDTYGIMLNVGYELF